MRWLVADSLYRPEAFFCSHLDSYSYYLREFGEEVGAIELKGDVCRSVAGKIGDPPDVLFALDRYDLLGEARVAKRIAQVAAICSPMPWEVSRADGSPAYDCVISSIPWMVEATRAAGCRAEYMPLAFDTRARVCGMGITRDLGTIFIGTVGPNHKRRAELLNELRDVVTVLPPVFGREYFRTLARAKVVLSPHAEWAHGALNNMRMFEAAGMGAVPLAEGIWPDDVTEFGLEFSGSADGYTVLHDLVERGEWRKIAEWSTATVLREHTYESRIPHLVEIARSL